MNEKYKVGVRFDKELLQSLRNDENSGVELKRSKYHMSLHPIQLNNFSKSMKQVLNQSIAKYNKDLDGILLGFEKTKLLSKEGYIHDDSSYIHLDIEANFYVFRPEIGKEMKGTVNRKSKDHVGLLVYNALNVSILKPKDIEEWIGEFVELGSEILFRITYISLTSFMPYIRGEIISVLTDVNSLSKANNNGSIFSTDDIENTGKKQKSKKRKQSEPIGGTSNSKRRKVDDSLSDKPEHSSVRKKHSKNLSSDIVQSPSDLANNNSKKKTKHHNNSSLQNSTGYTTFEENLIENMGSIEEISLREQKVKKDKSHRKRRFSETTVIPSISERSRRFSSIESPMLKVIGDDSMSLTLDNGDCSTSELEGLTDKIKTKVKKDKHKNIGLLENNNSLHSYIDDTQITLKVEEENVRTKKTKGKKLSNSVETCTFNIPIMLKEETGSTVDQGRENCNSGYIDVPVKKKSKKHKDKSDEGDK